MRKIVALGAALLLAALATPAIAQIPAGYYDSVDRTNAVTLRSTLHEVIDDHTRFPYLYRKLDGHVGHPRGG